MTVVLGCLRFLHVRTTRNSFDSARRFVTSCIANHFRSVAESIFSVVYWFPFYYTFKFIFLLWLSLPIFR